MTITNYASDGHYPELITLFRVVADQSPIPRDELIRLCTVSDPKHLRATLATWLGLGLFVEQEAEVTIDPRFRRKRNETLDELADRLPSMCRLLLLDVQHALPLWPANGAMSDDGIGASADFVREIAWTLAQDIYAFPFDASGEDAVALESEQITPGKFIFKNHTRWPGLCFWARYTGFASGDSRCIDPTDAIRAELPGIFQKLTELPASDFIRELSMRLPVLDFGRYRIDVESALNDSVWRRPPKGHLSTSLSLALRRLHLDRTIVLDAPADAGETFTLSGKNFRPLDSFSKIELRSGTP
jgi:hypothetical protein